MEMRARETGRETERRMILSESSTLASDGELVTTSSPSIEGICWLPPHVSVSHTRVCIKCVDGSSV